MNDKYAMPEDDDLPDPALRRALENAPDHAAVPGFHLRRTIRQMAHEAVGPSDAEVTESLDRSWWRQLLGLGAPAKSRGPWRAAFATVLVAVLVGVLWQRQPVPGPQLDSQAPTAPSLSTVAPATPAAPAAPAAAKDEPSAPAADASASAGGSQIALPPTMSPARELPPEQPPARLAFPQPTARDIEIEAALRKAQEAEREAQEIASKAVPIPFPGTGAARPPSPSPVAPPTTGSRRADERALSGAAPAAAADRRNARTRDEFAAAAPAPTPPAAMAPPPLQAGASKQAMSPSGAAPNAAASIAPGAAPSSPVRTEAGEPPTFAALGQWTRMTVIGPHGESRTYTRGEAGELGTLMGSAALAAVGPQPLRNKVEWRVMLERNGKPLAQFELARGEVRWREGGSAPATGQPPEGALDGLREALRDATAPAPPASNQSAPAPATVPPAQPTAPSAQPAQPARAAAPAAQSVAPPAAQSAEPEAPNTDSAPLPRQ
ncbi:hypothetical protein [Variovorax sp. dw_954]|uniref:hypothetical protein n=2 Tax=unclassified Variovorax TaxID=663243 RepID=UPI001BD1E2F7|nr:hypothetical protein [Variovorax sp. dw_954]